MRRRWLARGDARSSPPFGPCRRSGAREGPSQHASHAPHPSCSRVTNSDQCWRKLARPGQHGSAAAVCLPRALGGQRVRVRLPRCGRRAAATVARGGRGATRRPGVPGSLRGPGVVRAREQARTRAQTVRARTRAQAVRAAASVCQRLREAQLAAVGESAPGGGSSSAGHAPWAGGAGRGGSRATRRRGAVGGCCVLIVTRRARLALPRGLPSPAWGWRGLGGGDLSKSASSLACCSGGLGARLCTGRVPSTKAPHRGWAGGGRACACVCC